MVFSDHLTIEGLDHVRSSRLCELWALMGAMLDGNTLRFTYVPGKGTTLRVADKDLGVFEGKGFADAVLSIWLGPKPPSEDLKKGMLGG